MTTTISGTTGVSLVQDNVIVAADLMTGQTVGIQKMQLLTAQAASGTTIDFTGLPSWAKKFKVMLNGISTSGTSNLLLQIGDGAVVASGYDTTSVSAIAVSSVSSAAQSGTGLQMTVGGMIAATTVTNGAAELNLFDGNTWELGSSLSHKTGPVGSCVANTSKTLSGTLDRIRLTTVNGTDTIDAGSVNVLVEGYE